MQNVATSIFYAGLFAGIYDAAIGILLLPIYLQRCFFLCVASSSRSPCSLCSIALVPVFHHSLSFSLSLFLSCFYRAFTDLLVFFISFSTFLFLFCCLALRKHQELTSFFSQDGYRHFFVNVDFSNHCSIILKSVSLYSRFILYIYFLYFC